MATLSATHSGPGILLSWPAASDASFFTVLAAREPSPTFYELPSSCCPLLPTQRRPCCPVVGDATSLQIEGLDPGVHYRFRVTAHAAANATVGESASVRVPSVPTAPGAPTVLASSDGAIVDLEWSAPGFDGDDLIRGYRIWADVTSLNASGRVLIANTTAGRPLTTAYDGAPSSHVRLPLLPSHRYRLAVQALNAAGGGPLSVPTLFDAPLPAAAECARALLRTKPLETNPLGTKPLETKPLRTKPLRTKPLRTKPHHMSHHTIPSQAQRKPSPHHTNRHLSGTSCH